MEFDNNRGQVLSSGDARAMFLYLFRVDDSELDLFGEKILETGNLIYLHYLLRSFQIKNYIKILPKILTSDDSKYLFNILYDVDYLNNESRLKIINRIIELGDNKYILKAVHYYFVVLDSFDGGLLEVLRKKLGSDIDEHDYEDILNKVFYQDDFKMDPEGFSKNCYKGRNGHIPNLIVCHINNTYSSAIEHFYDERSEVSSHFVIRRDGHVKQVVNLDDSAWANGTSMNSQKDNYYKFATSEIVKNTDDNANYFSFSIEHESFDGNLTKEQFTATIETMRKIIAYLKKKYNYDFPVDRQHIIGHNEVNPITRKKCPGKAFPFDEIIYELKNASL